MREKKGLSCNKLAKITGLSQPYIWNMERGLKGNIRPSYKTLKKLSDALECNIDDLLN
jgi:transcriptional regulator with XRE-family HTH domain